MKKFLSVLGLMTLLAGCAFFSGITNDTPKNPDPNHTHADFAVWIDGEKLDFSDPKYMPEAPAEPTEEEANFQFFPSVAAHGGIIHETLEEETEHDNLQKYLHLHDGNGSVIHRHKPGLTIGDFFTSIGFTMTSECFTLDTGKEYCSNGKSRWRMFVNDQEQAFDPEYIFMDLDRILLTYSASDTAYIEQLQELADDACLYSKTCPERGTPPVENCISDPEIPCVLPE